VKIAFVLLVWLGVVLGAVIGSVERYDRLGCPASWKKLTFIAALAPLLVGAEAGFRAAGGIPSQRCPET
jgi:hypothetical protein